MFDEHEEIYLFFTVLRPDSILQATWIHTYLKLLRLPLSGGQPSRLTNSFVEYHQFDSLMSHFINFKMKDKTTNMLYVLRMASLMLSTVGIIAFSRFCA